jgi:hypothetical protein
MKKPCLTVPKASKKRCSFRPFILVTENGCGSSSSPASSSLSLSVLLASRQEQQGKLIAPGPVSNAAITGLELYGKHGGSKKLRLSQALADRSSITAKDLDEMLDFFENSDID